MSCEDNGTHGRLVPRLTYECRASRDVDSSLPADCDDTARPGHRVVLSPLRMRHSIARNCAPTARVAGAPSRPRTLGPAAETGPNGQRVVVDNRPGSLR
jgi:hypothetical protein